MLRTLPLALLTAALPAWFAQQDLGKPRFEVASIKPSDPNPSSPMFIGMSADGAMVKYTNITLLDCIRGAYRVREFQIVGPDWITKARFEIDAKLPPGASADQIPEMLQSLLAECFKLDALVVADGEAKLKPAERKPDNYSPRDLMMYGFPPGGVLVTAPSATVSSLARLMSRFTARPVVDMTGIEGQYEFKLIFEPEINPGLTAGPAPTRNGAPFSVEPAPSVFDAVKQYGLRLEPRRAPIEMIFVTHLEKAPTDN